MSEQDELLQYMEDGISVAQCAICGKSGDICKGCAYVVAAGILASQFLAKVKQHYEQNRPRIICLCGSTRFKKAFHQAYAELSDAGYIVLTVARLIPDHNEAKASELGWKELHLRKIDLADEIFVLNVGGYIGESLRYEIDYTTKLGKTIKYLEAINV